MAKKESDIVSRTVDIVAAGAGLGIGGMTLGAIGAQGGTQVKQLAAAGQRGLGVMSVGLPVMAGVGVLKELEKAGKK